MALDARFAPALGFLRQYPAAPTPPPPPPQPQPLLGVIRTSPTDARPPVVVQRSSGPGPGVACERTSPSRQSVGSRGLSACVLI